MALLPILSGIGAAIGAGGGSESTTESSFDSTTDGTSTINRSELSPKLLRALNALFSKRKLLDSQALTMGALTQQIGRVNTGANNPFDIQKYVDGIMGQANNTIQNQAGEAIALGESDIGGTQGNNSMAALLAHRTATDATAQLGGIQGEATAKGYEIAQGQQQATTESLMGLTGSINKGFTDYLQILRGAKTKQKQKTNEHTAGTSTSTTSSPFDPLSAIGGFLGSFKAPV